MISTFSIEHVCDNHDFDCEQINKTNCSCEKSFRREQRSSNRKADDGRRSNLGSANQRFHQSTKNSLHI